MYFITTFLIYLTYHYKLHTIMKILKNLNNNEKKNPFQTYM